VSLRYPAQIFAFHALRPIDNRFSEAWARAVPQWLKPGASDSVGISTFPGRRGFRPAVIGDGPL